MVGDEPTSGAAPSAAQGPVAGAAHADMSSSGASSSGAPTPDERAADGASEGADEVGYRGPQVCALVGITYRQLDYWARTGLLANRPWLTRGAAAASASIPTGTSSSSRW